MTEHDDVRKALEGLGPGFELVRELGRGTTAVVYLVRDNELERNLAVKVIRPSFTHDEEAVARLRREARLVAQLQHPNIVRVFSTRHLPGGSLALLMEHVPGQDLEAVLRSTGPFDTERTLSVLRDVASALAYAHRRRIVHRDVKPENIYVDDEVGAARLADFGIARPWDRDARLTVPGEALGTPAYMSPEQIDGKDVDARTDVYSLGLVGYEMLAGGHPWEGDSLFNIIFKQKNEELPSLRSQRPDVPGELIRALERALEKDRERRWDSAEAFLEALDSIRDRGAWAPARTSAATTTEAEPSGAAAISGSGEPEVPAQRSGREDARRSGTPVRSGGRRWRVGRVAGAAVALVALAAAVWAWAAVRGANGNGWVNLGGESEAGVRSVAESPEAVPPLPDSTAEIRALQVVEAATASEGPVGAAVPLAVRVPASTDSVARVRFTVVEGQGVLEREVVGADREGTARATLRLPPQPGATTVVARLEGGEGQELRLRVEATPGPPRQVVSIVGDRQVGEAGSFLPRDLGVRVLDALGNPVPNAEVRFQVLAGDGTVAPTAATTDSLGGAFARWRLGAAPGTQQTAARVPAAGGATVLFGAVARGQTQAPAAEAEPVDPSPDPEPVGSTGSEPDTSALEAPTDPAGDPGPGADTPPVVSANPLTVGGTHVCVIGARGFADCLGALDPDPDAAAVRVRFASLAAGVSHVCGLDSTGTAYCWGANGAGQLGDGTRADRSAPSSVETASLFSRLALGLGHSCGLDGGGRVHCWGRNVNGQLGDGTRSDRPVPQPAGGPGGMVNLAAGWNHSCALDGSGRAHCWGLNSDGQLGDGSRVDRVTPTPVAGGATFSTLAAGSAHTCGLGNGVVRCWGSDSSGQLGIGSEGGASEPQRLESLPESVIQVVTGAVHSCALLRGGEAYCWGQNVHGQLGDGSTTDRRLPVAVAGELRFQRLSAGGGSTCGVTNDGTRYCWGLNQSGQLGDGTRTNRSTPFRAG